MHGDLDLVRLGRAARGAILRDHDGIAMTDRLHRSAHQRDIGRHAAEDHRVDPETAQRGVEIGAGKGGHAMMAFGYDVAVADNDVVMNGGETATRNQIGFLVDARREDAIAVPSQKIGPRGDGAMHDREAPRAKAGGKFVYRVDNAARSDLLGERRLAESGVGDPVLHLRNQQRGAPSSFESLDGHRILPCSTY